MEKQRRVEEGKLIAVRILMRKVMHRIFFKWVKKSAWKYILEVL